MELTVAYHGRSGVRSGAAGLAVALAPNLRRDRVSFVGNLRSPLRFREAISALHHVVISDLRFKPKDQSAYEAYKQAEQQREEGIRQAARQAVFARNADRLPEGLEDRFRLLRRQYWGARQKYANYLAKNDPALWRLLMPCDPVITVSPDVLFFECFSADESSYGCLTVDRGAFAAEGDVRLGTTNVDYSLALYEEMQKLRTYRQTQFRVDPGGFEVRTQEAGVYREEKIPLPPSWLRGFLQLQAAMSLPMRRVPVSREGLYNVLAFLKRHRARKSPRALRFELTPGQPVELVLEPWEERLILHGTPYPGPKKDTIRTWGRDRLGVLARLLPLAEGADVYLLGTGLPSFWSVKMGDMRLLLGLSGWTANDWTGGSALDQLMPPAEPSKDLVGDVAAAFRSSPTLTFEQIRQRIGGAAPFVAVALNKLALMGQLIHDLPAGVYRWRQVMPVTLSAEVIGPESPETEGARELVAQNKVKVTRSHAEPDGARFLTGKVGDRAVELTLDADGRMVKGKCNCSHHFQFGLRRGPCRHLQALRTAAAAGKAPANVQKWFDQLWG